MTVLDMVCPAAPVPSHADRDREHARHDHRYDITPEMVRADPDPNALALDLIATYGIEQARTLFAIADEQEAA